MRPKLAGFDGLGAPLRFVLPALPQLNGYVAAGTLVVIVFAAIVMWPIPHLGFAADSRTYRIESVEPASAAGKAGLRIGDRIIRLYDRPMTDVFHTVRIADLIGPRDHAIPITVARAGQIITTMMVQEQPTVAFQASKAALTGLALLCWLTGYQLGVVRRHEVPGSHLVAIFWLGMAAIVGSLGFARYTAPPIYVALLWLLVFCFVPLSIYIHRFFPPRQATLGRGAVGRYCIAALILITSGAMVAGYFGWFSMIDQLAILSNILPFEIFGALASIGWILHRAYRQTSVAHTRRQIRLIIIASLAITLLWFLLFVVPTIVIGHSLIDTLWLVVLTGMLPLAYLIGGVALDLYRLDRIATRSLVHLVTTSFLASALTLVVSTLHLHGIAASIWSAIAFVALYGPIQHWVLRVLPPAFRTERNQALEITIQELAYSLDAPTLVRTLVRGLRAEFADPAVAYYLQDTHDGSMLTLYHQERMAELPTKLAVSSLTRHLRRSVPVIESRLLRHIVLQDLLPTDEQRLLTHPAIALWCPVWHMQGSLLGLLVLGMRGDLDPYYPNDQQKLQRLLAAASLAFANSAAYMRQREAEETIRQLYQRLQSSQDETGRAIARELHDEIINVHVRLNIESLRKIAARVIEPDLLRELDLVLESEEEVIATLRTICERLHPTGLDDPLGLPSVLETQLERAAASWPGSLRVDVSGIPQPLAPETQREALQIAKESVANAIKHANAKTIVVSLKYPSSMEGFVELAISDDGQGTIGIAPQRGHWGVKGMQERARTVGGTLTIQSQARTGTTVVFTFAARSCRTDVRS